MLCGPLPFIKAADQRSSASAMQEESSKMANETVGKLRILAHDLSNAIETVMQASYLLAQSRLDDENQKWLKMIDTAAQDAARINREIREILRAQDSAGFSPPSA
jgi:signal transduction histidine kinase